MTDIKAKGDCTDTGCIAPKKPQPILIDFLYLDDASHDWQSALSALNEAIDETSNLLNASGLYIEVEQTIISSAELAASYRFVCSPTILINDTDIAQPPTCSENNPNHRVWHYKGAQYNTVPKPLLVSAVIKAIYGAAIPVVESPYSLPSNLKTFFAK